MEWELAHHRGADTVPAGPDHGRLQYVRFRVSAKAGRILGDAGVLCGFFRERLWRGVAIAASIRAGTDRAGRVEVAYASGALQLVGSHSLRRERTRTKTARRQSGSVGRGIVRRRRWLVR